jgi:hypothetical protein
LFPCPSHEGFCAILRDEPVLGTALAGNAQVLCTLDRHFRDRQVLDFAAEHGIQIMTGLQLLAFLGAPPEC